MVQRQADTQINRSLSNDAEIAVLWKLCDNGFAVDEGIAFYIFKSGQIDWRGRRPPAEDEGLLRELIHERAQKP